MKDYCATKKTLSYISKDHILSFCEVKHLTPFPELMVNFIGTVHELRPNYVDDYEKYTDSEYIVQKCDKAPILEDEK